jgi:cytochrome c peroxidase
MGMPSLDAVVARVRDDPEYPPLFQQAYADNSPISMEKISAAIASFERTLISPDSPYDRFVRGDVAALNAPARRGMALFESVGCVQCHFGSNFSDASASRVGSPYRIFPATNSSLDPALHLSDDKGRAAPDSRASVWRVPSLRNVALTAPYFHNGAVEKLEDAVRIMAQAQLGLEIVNSGAGTPVAFWSPTEHTMQLSARRTLSEREISDISEFLRALSSDALVAAAKKGGT